MKTRRAFTMVELMMTVTIMGIIAALVLKAMTGGIRRAEEKATIGLIAKLEAALTDRVDALQNDHPQPTGLFTTNAAGQTVILQHGHATIAAVYNGTQVIQSPSRAQTIAFYDNLRADLPDVFVVQNNSPTATSGIYPINFGGATIANVNDNGNPPLPLGTRMPIGADGTTFQVTGMYGASFAAAAGIYQQLGYAPQGYNGADDNNDGYIDDAKEGLTGLDPTQVAQIQQRLQKHQHSTARAEMLYAILIYGAGPMGSNFDPDDFSKNEVGDTDGDGLLEFIDAWGQPLQFYRWPLMYNSDTQRGFPTQQQIATAINNKITPGPYTSAYEARENNTLDPNNLLLAPAWFTNDSSVANSGPGLSPASGTISGGAMTFQTFFHTLLDPMAALNGGPSATTFWDRSSTAKSSAYGTIYPRRAYYNRFLVLSGGPDKIPGTAQLGVNYQGSTNGGIDERSQIPVPSGGFVSYTSRDTTGAAVSLLAPPPLDPMAYVVQIENQAGRVDPNRAPPLMTPTLNSGRNDTNSFLEDAGNDDISSQNIHALGGPLQ